jgi:S1-C subfamily serine protease
MVAVQHPLTEVIMMSEYLEPTQTPSQPVYPPPPPPPSGGGARTLLLAIAAAVIIAVAVVLIMPLIFGANPIDVLSGKEKVTVQTEEVRTVEERVVTAGQEAVVEVASKLLPSVVYIEVTYGDSAFGFESTGIGSGFIYTEDGYIVTNNHVVEGASDIKVAIADGSTYDAELIGRDPETDLANCQPRRWAPPRTWLWESWPWPSAARRASSRV